MQSNHMLVTGSAGFIGSAFVRIMLERYPTLHVVSIDKLTYAGNIKNLDDLPNQQHHTFFQADITDEKTVTEIMHAHTIDTIVHFAAESHVDNSIVNPQAFVMTNVVGTFTLLEAARHYWLNEKKWDASRCRFNHISTDEVYGSLKANDPAFTETTRYQPNSPYSASKAGSDHLAHAYFHTYQLPITISNCSNNFGPHQHPEKLIPTVIRCCKNQAPIPVYGNGLQIRDWLHVDDHCDAIDLILKKGVVGEQYNIGGNNEMDNLTLIQLICSEMDRAFPQHAPHARLITFVTDRPGHDQRYAIDNTKIKETLGWTPKRKMTFVF